MNIRRFLVFIIGFISHSAFANQGIYGGHYNPGVILYSDCDFSGKAARLNFGDYHSLKQSPVGNDSVSSIRVPQGMVAIIYEDDNFEGEEKYVYHDSSCVPKRWNDRISSIRVVRAGSEQAYDNWNNHNNAPVNHGYNHNYGNGSYNNQTYNNQQRCHNFKIYSHGGAGVFRFVDQSDDVIRVNNSSKTSSTCRSGNVRIELSKNNPGATTAIEINGQRYTFGANQPHDSYKNNWYRKYIDLYLP